MSRVGFRLRVVASMALLTVGAVLMLVVAVPTLFLARRFYSEVMTRWLALAVLRLWRVRYVVHHLAPEPPGQRIYVSNHTSTIDLFLLVALGLPRTRFFLSGFLRKLVPLGIIGYLIRIFWTVPQEFPEQRRKIFARADRILRRTGDSVYLSPEGMRVTTGEIGHFNKGAFHLATSLHAPIVPIYFAIPPDMNPGMGYDAKPGIVDIWFLPAIDTSAWRLDELDRNRAAVRDLFLRVHDEYRMNGRLDAGAVAAAAPSYAEAGV
jgi:1-acyl-sn-glycerol-3-phosphate acyltransferase